jgi:hypothetical protein
VWAGRPPLTARRVTSGQAARCSGGEEGRVDARLDGITGHFCSPAGASLVADPLQMRSHRVDRQEQPPGDLGVGRPSGQQCHDSLPTALNRRSACPCLEFRGLIDDDCHRWLHTGQRISIRACSALNSASAGDLRSPGSGPRQAVRQRSRSVACQQEEGIRCRSRGRGRRTKRNDMASRSTTVAYPVLPFSRP